MLLLIIIKQNLYFIYLEINQFVTTVLAGLSLHGGARRRKVKVRVKVKVMEWCRKMVFPVRKVWLAVSARLKARKKGAGLLKLHDDIQTCGYEDVQIMWEMLRRTESELTLHNNKGKQRYQRILLNFSWFNHSPAGRALSTDQTQ